MKPTLLISGDRADFTTLTLDINKRELSIVANYPSPFNVSWVELSSSLGAVDRFVGLSEGEESGLLYTFEIDHEKKSCKITSQKDTGGAPAHFITLQDQSALALGTFLGGSAALYPVSITEKDGILLEDAPRTEFFPKFPYEAIGYGPNKSRQRQCHVHQVLEDKRGLLYAPDLGADRVWILGRSQMNLTVIGWLQCPPGTGTRHAVFSPDEELLYVVGELSHTVIAFDLKSSPAEDILPIEGFAANIIPPTVDPDRQLMMDSAELCSHPTIPSVLYASNRWERHIARRQPELENVPEKLPQGDAVAIILLSQDGRSVEGIQYVRTKLDTIRGMRLSDDGSYAVLVGQEGGGVEVYAIRGERGEEWTLFTSLNKGLEDGIKHAIWL